MYRALSKNNQELSQAVAVIVRNEFIGELVEIARSRPGPEADSAEAKAAATGLIDAYMKTATIDWGKKRVQDVHVLSISHVPGRRIAIAAVKFFVLSNIDHSHGWQWLGVLLVDLSTRTVSMLSYHELKEVPGGGYDFSGGGYN